MSDENLSGESQPEDAPVLAGESQPADSSPATDKATESPADDASKTARDDEGKFLSPKVQKRIDHLTWEKAQEAREKEYWRAQALQVQQAAKPAEPPAPPAARPKLADFEYDESRYEAAVVEFTRAEARAAAEAVLAERENESAAKAKAQTFKERESAFKAETPDYESVAYYAPISNEVAELVKESESGPELAYYLGKNPEIAQTLSQLPERAAAREIGKIEARLAFQKEAAKAAPPPAVSKAPPPPPRIEASNSEMPVRTTDASGDSLTDDEWVRAERQRINKLRKRNG